MKFCDTVYLRLLFNHRKSKLIGTFIFGQRNKSGIKIIQQEPLLLSKGDRIKKLNYENKFLYGARTKDVKKHLKAKTHTSLVSRDTGSPNQNDISSEIYWTCLHVPDYDYTRPKQVAKLAKKETAANKKQQKKKLLGSRVQLPETLTHFPIDLPSPSPVKIIIKNTLETSFKAKSLYPEYDKSPSNKSREIPFANQQLRSIINFPLMFGNDRIVNIFEPPFVPELSCFPIPSVTKVLQATMMPSQRNALMQWKNLKIAELGLEGFELLQNSHRGKGKLFHQCLQRYFSGVSIDKKDITPDIIDIWNSIEPVLKEFQAPGVLIEQDVVHPFLYYKGVVDCVTYHDSTVVVVEWKNSGRRHQKPALNLTFDAPVQLVSYLGALNFSRKEFNETPIENGVVVVAYNDGSSANVFKLSEGEMKKYWKLWLNRLQEYWILYRDNTLPESI